MLTSLQTRLLKAGRLLPLVLLPFAVQAQAPANDNCSAATALTVGTTCTNVAGTNANATATAGTAAPTCGGTVTTGSNDVWYSLVVPASGSVTVSTSAATGSLVDDTVVELLTGTCGSLTSVACNDDASTANGFSTVTTTGRTVGSTLYVRVMTYGTSPAGAFNICATVAAPALTNDDPAGAISLVVGTTCSPVNGTNVGSTTTTPNGYMNGTNPNAACGIAVNPRDVFYRFTTPATGAGSTAVTITVTGAAAGYLRVFSTTGGAAGPFTEIGCASGGTNNAVSAPLTVTGLTPGATYYVFVSGFGSGDAMGPFTICATATPSNDLGVQAIYTLGTVSTYASPVGVRAVIRNFGIAASTARTITLTVSGATTYSNTQNVPVIAAGASTTVTFPSYPVTATTGTNTVAVTLAADDLATNNTATVSQALTASRLSYIDPSITTFTGGFGSNSTTVNTATVYVKYTVSTTPTTVTAVTPTFAGPATASNNYQVLIVDATGPGGNPGTVLYTSPPRVRPLAGGADVVAIPGTPVPASFYVAVRQLSTTNFGLAYQNESPLRQGTFFFSTDGITFTDLGVANTNFRAAIDVTLRNPLATQNAALAAMVALYPNPAHQSFQLSVPAGSLRAASATLINSLGQVVQSRQLDLPAAGGIATFNVSSLAAGVYSLQLKSGNDLVVKRVVVE